MSKTKKQPSAPRTRFSPQKLRRLVILHCADSDQSLAGFARVCFPQNATAPQMLDNLLAGRVASPGYKTLCRLAFECGCTVNDLME